MAGEDERKISMGKWQLIDNIAKAEIKDLYKSGATTSEIAKLYGVSTQVVVYHLKRMGVDRRDGRRKYSYDFAVQLGEEYENTDITVKQLAEKYNMPAGSVGTLIYKYYDFHKANRTHPSAKRVLQIDKQGKIVRVYRSALEAAKETGLYQVNISKCCLGKLKTSGGYCWKYDEGE